jgi:peptide chain release factor 2
MELEKESKELIQQLDILGKKIAEQHKLLQIETRRSELRGMEAQMEQPDFWNDADKATAISQKKASLEKQIERWDYLSNTCSDSMELLEMAIEEADDETARSIIDIYQELEQGFTELELEGVLSKEEDRYNAFVNIHPGAGGTESQDWAEMLLRMYLRWFEQKGWNATILDQQPGEQAGIKNVNILVKGENVFGLLKSENGIHRLVRISPFDSNKRRHTSFVGVHVSPEIPEGESEVEIAESDLRIDTYRSSGAGGQHVNTTDSAVRMTHIPTGIVVQCQNERSQIKNRDTAMKMLKSRLAALEVQKKEEELQEKSGEKKDIAWGSQIRSYVFHPYNMVKDHRTNHETGDVAKVMDGNLDPFIHAYLKNLTAVTS